MSWSLKLTGRNLGIVGKNLTRLMWNLLVQKNNYLKKVGSDHAKLRQLMLVEEFKWCIIHDMEKDWDEGIHLLLFAVRESVQESLGFSPFELVFGHTLREPLKHLKEKNSLR